LLRCYRLATGLHFFEVGGADERRPHRMVDSDSEERGDAAHFGIEICKQIVGMSWRLHPSQWA
jgi:hypothetical protein